MNPINVLQQKLHEANVENSRLSDINEVLKTDLEYGRFKFGNLLTENIATEHERDDLKSRIEEMCGECVKKGTKTCDECPLQ